MYFTNMITVTSNNEECSYRITESSAMWEKMPYDVQVKFGDLYKTLHGGILS